MRKNAPHAASFRVFGHFRPRMTYIRNEHTFFQKRNQCITTRRANAIPKMKKNEKVHAPQQEARQGVLRGVRVHPRRTSWVCNPEVEAENNLAERRLRPLVIARKVCFGSQSEKGLMTRETLMTIIDTLSLMCDDPVAKLSQVLDAIGRDKKANVSELLWGPKTQPANVAKA